MRVAVTVLLAGLLAAGAAGCSSAPQPSPPSTHEALAAASRNLEAANTRAVAQQTAAPESGYGLSPADAATVLGTGRTVATGTSNGREVFASRRPRIETSAGAGGFRSVEVSYYSVRCLDEEYDHEFRTSQAAVGYAGDRCGGNGRWRSVG